MEYVQLNEALTEATQITTAAPIVWDENNYCTAAALVKDGKGDQFRVYTLLETDAPAFDANTHKCYRDGCELVNGQWQYKWTVVALTPEELAAAAKAKVPKSVTPRQIRQALTRFNVRAQVEAAVAAGDQDLKDWWEFATAVERNHPMVIAMATGLGLTEAQLDGIFMAAGAL